MTPPQLQDAIALFNQGLQQLQAGNYSAALADFDTALAISPNNPNIWEKRALVLQNLGRYAAALASNKIALSFYSNNIELFSADVWFDLGYEQAIEGDILGALACFDKALELKPDDQEALYSRGIALYDLGRFEEAVACFDKALELKPDDYKAWHNRMLALFNLGRLEEAIAP